MEAEAAGEAVPGVGQVEVAAEVSDVQLGARQELAWLAVTDSKSLLHARDPKHQTPSQ